VASVLKSIYIEKVTLQNYPTPYENINCPRRLVASSPAPAPTRNKKKNHKKNRNMFTPTVGLLHQAMWPNPNK
jgi:hypothetical protein